MPYVEVQHPSGAQWTRYFSSPEEAEMYKHHVTSGRGMIASIRPDRCMVVELNRTQLLQEHRTRKGLLAAEMERYL